MSVELDPPELHFKRPFSREVSQTLKLHNPSSTPIAFKVKTTAPKQYCVRPNSGRIEANSDVEVQVLLQAMKEDPPPDAKCRDKFLVQTIAIGESMDSANAAALWSQMEQTSKSSIHEKKIRVQFLAADSATPVKAVNGVNYLDSPAVNSPSSPQAVTPAPSTNKEVPPSSREAPPATTSGLVGQLPESAQAQLAEAQAQIARLTQQLKEQGELRQRKVAASLEEKGYPQAAHAVANPSQAGVPLKWVAILCLLSFLVAYLFF